MAIVATGGGLYLYADSSNQAAILAAGDSEVSFVAEVTGEPAVGVFTDTQVTAIIDQSNPAASSIMATVQTASVSSDNSQLESTLPDTEWFNVSEYPQAVFESTAIESIDDGTLQVTGRLGIKDKIAEISFPMTIKTEAEKLVARGEFTISRQDFNMGMISQENEDFVAHDVTVSFRFDISQTDG